jgi:uncharacterized protein (TIGR00299 family) protein
MRIAYFDCFSGVSGDMTLGALLACGAELGVSAEDCRADLARLNLPGWELDVQTVSRSGIGAQSVTVRQTIQDQGHGRHLSDIRAILEASDLPETVRGKALRVFSRLADAEAKIHQTTPDKIHFHEVGAIDAIVDIVGACLLLERLGIGQIHCSPLPMGHGFVECQHGTIPLPAPATLELLRGFPVYSAGVAGELVTPTGAALMTTLAQFGPMPTMTVAAAGYGAGKKDFGNRPNLLRVIIGEEVDTAFSGAAEVTVLEMNLDDMSPQFYEPLTERLQEAGAADVFLAPIQMKKGRPGTLLTVLAPPERAETLAGILFTETTTLGIRYQTVRRLCLDREWTTVMTEYGAIRVKVGHWQGKETNAAPEYEEVKAAARRHTASVKAVHQAAMTAYLNQK